MNEEPLFIWTIYKGEPGRSYRYVAAKFVVTGEGAKITDERIPANDIEGLREVMRRLGLFPIGRQPEDDDTILESWI